MITISKSNNLRIPYLKKTQQNRAVRKARILTSLAWVPLISSIATATFSRVKSRPSQRMNSLKTNKRLMKKLHKKNRRPKVSLIVNTKTRNFNSQLTLMHLWMTKATRTTKTKAVSMEMGAFQIRIVQ
jgi:hypothetical protein